jgi:uncharacterized protein DUF2188
MANKKLSRTRFEVLHSNNFKTWYVNYRTSRGRRLVMPSGRAAFIGGGFALKKAAVKYAVEWARANAPSQLFIKGENGRIQDERTYGNDPRKTKG